jgi:hypothetical protein
MTGTGPGLLLELRSRKEKPVVTRYVIKRTDGSCWRKGYWRKNVHDAEYYRTRQIATVVNTRSLSGKGISTHIVPVEVSVKDKTNEIEALLETAKQGRKIAEKYERGKINNDEFILRISNLYCEKEESNAQGHQEER